MPSNARRLNPHDGSATRGAKLSERRDPPAAEGFPLWGSLAIPAGVLWGTALGVVAGLVFGNLAIGAAIGAGLGVGVGLAVFAAAIVTASRNL